MSTTVRIDAESDALLGHLAVRSGRSKSDILHEALVRFAEKQADSKLGEAPHELVEDLIGIARGGPDDLARRHKQAFRELLARRTGG